jgi:hypothetical protein
LLWELFGTFLLVLVVGGAGTMGHAFSGVITRTDTVVAPALMVMGVILFMGKLSGAHLDPAVSIAFALRRDFPRTRVPGYIVVQLIGRRSRRCSCTRSSTCGPRTDRTTPAPPTRPGSRSPWRPPPAMIRQWRKQAAVRSSPLFT